MARHHATNFHGIRYRSACGARAGAGRLTALSLAEASARMPLAR